MRRSVALALVLWLCATGSGCAQTRTLGGDTLVVRSATGLELRVAANPDPALRVVLPGSDTADRAIEVLFPEHVTALQHGRAVAEQLYMFRRGTRGERPRWRKAATALEYERELPGGVHLLARATLEDDGVRFHYEFRNQSAVAYDMIYAVTDPRLTSIFHDDRLERTFVHHRDGFDLLASETPARLTMPIAQWLPARYLVDVNVSALTAPLRQRNRHVLTIQRRHVEIDGRRAPGVQLVWIYNHALGRWRVRRREGDQKWLLFWRLPLDGKQ